MKSINMLKQFAVVLGVLTMVSMTSVMSSQEVRSISKSERKRMLDEQYRGIADDRYKSTRGSAPAADEVSQTRDTSYLMQSEIDSLKAEVAALRAENASLRAENASLRAENSALKKR